MKPDDKCPKCGEWTEEAFRGYHGHYNDGSPMGAVCECEYPGMTLDPVTAWDLGLLSYDNPFRDHDLAWQGRMPDDRLDAA